MAIAVMNTRARMVLIGAAALLLALLPAVVDAPLTRRQMTTAVQDRTSVRIAHELVPAAIIEELTEKRPAAYRARGTARRHTRPDGIVSRARQLIIGDGRHRPEPFPRAGQ